MYIEGVQLKTYLQGTHVVPAMNATRYESATIESETVLRLKALKMCVSNMHHVRVL